jgi:hypothetical protein
LSGLVISRCLLIYLGHELLLDHTSAWLFDSSKDMHLCNIFSLSLIVSWDIHATAEFRMWVDEAEGTGA